MPSDQRRTVWICRKLTDHLRAEDGMSLHLVPFVTGQLARLGKNCRIDRDLAKIVNLAGALDSISFLGCQAHLEGQRAGSFRHPPGMAGRVGVAQLNNVNQ
jgi:hypothetical protein